MSIQIAVRLPDDVVAFLDRSIAEGRATSRATLVSAAIEREMRRHAAEQDAAIMRSTSPDDDLDGLVSWTAGNVTIDD